MASSSFPRRGGSSVQHRRRLRALWLPAAFAVLGALPLRADVQTWLGDGGNGGNGAWTTTTDWNPNTWKSGNTALFGGTAGIVSFGSTTQTVGGLIFNVGGYTLGGGTILFNPGSIITTNGGTTTFASTLNLTGAAGLALTKTGSGTLALSSSNAGLGTSASPASWTITGGTFSGGTFDSILSIGAGSNLGATPSSGTTATQVILDAGTLLISGTNLAPAIGSGRTIQVNAAGGAIVDSNGNPFYGNVVNNAGAGSSLYLSNASGTTTFTKDSSGVGGVISGTGSLTWNGAGTLSLGGANTYSGGTTINSGTLSFTADNNLGADAGAVTLSGGTLSTASNLSGGTTSVFAHNIVLGTTGGTINVGSGGVLGLNYFNQNATGNLSGNGTLTKTGTGQLIASGNNAGFTGNWVVSGGLLEVQYNGSASLGSGSVTLAAGSEMAVNYAKTITNNVVSSGGTLSYAVGGGGTYAGTLSLATGTTTTIGLRDFYNANGAENGAITGVISGSGALNVTGGGTLTLNPGGNGGTTGNTFTGGVTLNTGSTLALYSGNALGAAPSAATVQLTFAGNSTLQFLTTPTAAVYSTRTLSISTGATATINTQAFNANIAGVIQGSGALAKIGTGALTLGGANTYAGGTTINAGVLEMTNNQAAGTGSITINSGGELSTLGSQITNAVTLNGGAVAWDYYSGTGNYQGPVTLLSGGGLVSLVNFYATPTVGGAISGTISGSISGAGSLTTTGANLSGTSYYGGVLTLSGNNTYTGGTTIGVGTTVLLGSSTALSGSSNTLNLAGTLTLAGYNYAVGALTLTGNTATAPASSPSVGSPGAGTLSFTFGANSTDSLSVASATINGTADLLFNPAALTTPGTYTLVTARNGTLGGTWEFAGAENMSSPTNSLIVKGNGNQYDPGSYYQLTLNNTGGSEQVVVTKDVPNKIITILPFGSSLTAGQSNQNPYNGGGYRTGLYLNLANDGRFIPNYVGSSTSLTSNSPNEGNLLTSANQLANEGHPGWTTIQMLANLNMSDGEAGNGGGYWLQPGNGENPNYITVNIGGNDAVNYGQDAAAMTAASRRLDAIVSEFNILRPGVSTILSSIIYRNDGSGKYSAGLDAYYNPAMQGVIFNHVLAGQNVSFLDLRNVLNYPSDISSDSIHPTQAGYDKMANAWYTSLIYGQAYWTGTQGNAWNTVNGASTNFAFDSALTTDRGRGLNDATANQYLVYPDVFFSSNTAVLNTVLGADTTIRSLNFTAGAKGPVTIGAGNTLTIGTVDSSVTLGNTYTLQNTGGITVQAGSGAHTIAANVLLGADQIWGNVSSNNLTVSGAIGGAHSLAFAGGYTVYNPGTFTPSADPTKPNQATFTTTPQTVQGAGGGFVLSGASNYTGTTTISGVTVTLDNAGTTTPRLAGTSGIILNPGGTLLLASSGGVSSDRINNNATLTMAGGTLNTNGLSEGMGALTLLATSVLELGNGASIVNFANSSGMAWTSGTQLRIYDWTGNTSGGGADRVFFGSDATGLAASQLAQVAFYSDAGSTFLGNGSILANGEIVPVPETRTILAGLLLLGIAGGHQWRRRARGAS